MTAARPDLDEAARFLRRLDPDPGARFAFQTFDDAKLGRPLTRVLWSPPPRALELARLNARGAGVYVAVNRFAPDARDRTAANVVGFRACFVDLDGAPLDPVLRAPLSPRIVIESSPGRWQGYWPLFGDVTRQEWLAVQRALSSRFDSDASVNTVERVMRLPGLYHQKAEPFRSRTELLSDERSYAIAELAAAFDVTIAEEEPRFAEALPDEIIAGSRNVKLTSLAGTMRGRGCGSKSILAALRVENGERCRPPLSDHELAAIATSVMRYDPREAWWAQGDAEDVALEERMRRLALTSDGGTDE